MPTALKIILRILIILLIVFALLIGAVWGFVYFKYKANIFSVIGTLNTLNQEVNTAQLAPKQFSTTDTQSMVDKVNASIYGLITQDENGNYKVNKTGTFPVMIDDIELTDKEVCALANILVNPDKCLGFLCNNALLLPITD